MPRDQERLRKALLRLTVAAKDAGAEADAHGEFEDGELKAAALEYWDAFNGWQRGHSHALDAVSCDPECGLPAPHGFGASTKEAEVKP